MVNMIALEKNAFIIFSYTYKIMNLNMIFLIN